MDYINQEVKEVVDFIFIQFWMEVKEMSGINYASKILKLKTGKTYKIGFL